MEGKEFVRDGPQFSARQSAGFQSPFGGFGQRKSTAPEASAGSIPFLTDALKYVIVISIRWYTCIKFSILGAKWYDLYLLPLNCPQQQGVLRGRR